jgi:hypothetical protein
VRDSKIRLPDLGAREVSEIITNNFSKAGWSQGYVSAIDSNGRTIWIAEAHSGNGQRFIMRADERLTRLGTLKQSRANHRRKGFCRPTTPSP